MRSARVIVLLTLAATLFGACQSDKKKQADGGNNVQAGTSTATNSSNVTTDGTESGYFTGIDGTNKFSLLMPGFRGFTVADTSIATIEKMEVSLSETTINTLLAEAKAKNPDLDTTRFSKQFSRKQIAYKLTPLKTGKTSLKSSMPGGKKDSWNKSSSITLVVNQYTPEMVALGKARYEREGTGTKRACKSCHETGESGAPPHALGHIMDISDAQAKEWITTGQTGDRVASITHKWEFDSDDEEAGVVAYLRTLQTNDLEQFTKLMFENSMANFQPPPPHE